MTLAVKPIPGTDAGYILSDLYETNNLVPRGEMTLLSSGIYAQAVETDLDVAIREARAAGWESITTVEIEAPEQITAPHGILFLTLLEKRMVELA